MSFKKVKDMKRPKTGDFTPFVSLGAGQKSPFGVLFWVPFWGPFTNPQASGPDPGGGKRGPKEGLQIPTFLFYARAKVYILYTFWDTS